MFVVEPNGEQKNKSTCSDNYYSTMKDVLYEVRCLKSNEDMILALTGQFKQLLKLSSECEDHIFIWLLQYYNHYLLL